VRVRGHARAHHEPARLHRGQAGPHRRPQRRMQGEAPLRTRRQPLGQRHRRQADRRDRPLAGPRVLVRPRRRGREGRGPDPRQVLSGRHPYDRQGPRGQIHPQDHRRADRRRRGGDRPHRLAHRRGRQPHDRRGVPHEERERLLPAYLHGPGPGHHRGHRPVQEPREPIRCATRSTSSSTTA